MTQRKQGHCCQCFFRLESIGKRPDLSRFTVSEFTGCPCLQQLNADGGWCQRHLFPVPSAPYYKCSRHKTRFIFFWWALKSNCCSIISQWGNHSVLDENCSAVSRLDENLCRWRSFSWCFKRLVPQTLQHLGVCHSDLDKSASFSVVCYCVKMCLQSDKAVAMLHSSYT